MINILNNHFKFKDKYLSLHKKAGITGTELDPKQFNQVLKERKEKFYEFSCTLTSFSNKNPSRLLKGLSYLLKGFSIRETENILNLSSLSRKGFDYFKEVPKNNNPNSLLYPSIPLGDKRLCPFPLGVGSEPLTRGKSPISSSSSEYSLESPQTTRISESAAAGLSSPSLLAQPNALFSTMSPMVPTAIIDNTAKDVSTNSNSSIKNINLEISLGNDLIKKDATKEKEKIEKSSSSRKRVKSPQILKGGTSTVSSKDSKKVKLTAAGGTGGTLKLDKGSLPKHPKSFLVKGDIERPRTFSSNAINLKIEKKDKEHSDSSTMPNRSSAYARISDRINRPSELRENSSVPTAKGVSPRAVIESESKQVATKKNWYPLKGDGYARRLAANTRISGSEGSQPRSGAPTPSRKRPVPLYAYPLSLPLGLKGKGASRLREERDKGTREWGKGVNTNKSFSPRKATRFFDKENAALSGTNLKPYPSQFEFRLRESRKGESVYEPLRGVAERESYNRFPTRASASLSPWPLIGKAGERERDRLRKNKYVNKHRSKKLPKIYEGKPKEKLTKNPNLFLSRFRGSVDWVENSKKGKRFQRMSENQYNRQFKNFKNKDLFLNNWAEASKKKKLYYEKISNYTAESLDLSWFNNISNIRKTLQSKYSFNTFLSSSQVINYFFNKNNQKVDPNSIYKYLKYYFYSVSAFISKPVISDTPEKTSIRLFFFIIPTNTILQKERKLKFLLRNKEKSAKDQKDKNVFNKIMNKFRIKEFLARWKESNNLVRLPYLPDAISNIFFNPNNHENLKRSGPLSSSLLLKLKPEILEELAVKSYKLDRSLSSNKVNLHNHQTLFNLNNEKLIEVDLPLFRAHVLSKIILTDKENSLIAYSAKDTDAGRCEAQPQIEGSSENLNLKKENSSPNLGINPAISKKDLHDSDSGISPSIISSDFSHLTSPLLPVETTAASSEMSQLEHLSSLSEVKIFEKEGNGSDLSAIGEKPESPAITGQRQQALRISPSPLGLSGPFTLGSESLTVALDANGFPLRSGDEGESEFKNRTDDEYLINTDGYSLTNLGKLSTSSSLKKLADKEVFKNGFNSLELLKLRETYTMTSSNKTLGHYFLFNLEKYFKKEIEIEIQRIKYPYHDSNILSQILEKSSTITTFRNMMKKIFYTATIKNPTNMISKQDFSIIPSFLSGVSVKLAGRIATQRVVPRFTVQNFKMGSLARGKVNYLNTARITHKSKRGAFSFTVTTSHFLENKKIRTH